MPPLKKLRRAELAKEISHLLRQLVRTRSSQYAPHVWLEVPLTIAQLKSLIFITFNEGTNFRKLAAALGVSAPSLSGIIDRLVEQRLVSREEDSEDRRVTQLKATEEGKTLVGKLTENFTGHMSGMLSELTMAELSALAKGLSALLRVAQLSQEKTGADTD